MSIPASPTLPSPRDEFQRLGLDRVPILASLKKDTSMALVLRAKEEQRFAARAPLLAQGDYSGRMSIIFSGLADTYRADPGERASYVSTLQPTEWFGEGSALSNQPALFSVEAKSACTLLSLDAAAFKALYRGEEGFRKLIDARYREQSLAAHLRIVPLFKGLPAESLRQVQELAELVVLPAQKVIAEKGKPADAVYLVRSGAVKCTVRGEGGEERIRGFYMDNSCFGESAVAGGEPQWTGTFETMAPTDLVRFPAEELRKISVGGDRASLAETASYIAKQESGAASGLFDLLMREQAKGGASADQLEIMVAKQSVKGGQALVIDLAKCVRCNACVESCVAVHADRVPRLSKTGNRLSTQKTLASACYHCEIPECMMACGYGAIRRDVRGTIDFIWDNCVGCTSCVSKCPYNVIRMTPPPDESPRSSAPSILADLPLIGRLFRPHEVQARGPSKQFNRITGKEEQVAGKAIKCDLCAGMPFEACVFNCPCSAIERVAPEALFES